MKMMLLALLCVVVLFVDFPKSRKINQQKSRIIELFEVRLKAAKLDLEADEVLDKHNQEMYKHNVELNEGGAGSDRLVREAKLAMDLSALDVRTSRNAVREAEILLELMVFGVREGSVSLDDFRMLPDPRPRRK